MKILILIVSLIFLSACGEKPYAPEKTSGRTLSASEKREQSRTAPEPEQEPEPQPPAPVYIPEEETIGQAQTPLLDNSASRVENINIACGAINGIVMYPGGSFSFNDTVGSRSEENGYGQAPVIVDGHSEQGCGGGVCQVSSTLYMAVSAAGLQVDERHSHSHKVPYAEKGTDATVVYGEKDLAFTNNTDGVITLFIWTDGTAVFSKITKKNT